MRRLFRSAFLTGALAAAAACGPVNRGLESVNQPVVSRTDYVLDISSQALRTGDGPEARRLDAWFDVLNLGYGDRVMLDDPALYPDRATRDAVAAIVARHGLLLSDAHPVTKGAIAAGQVRVLVSRSSASMANCPNWSRGSQPEFAASTMSNYGCATNANLAAMVANPEDLVRGQAGDNGTDARSVNKAVKAYRDAQPTATGGLKSESTKSGGQ